MPKSAQPASTGAGPLFERRYRADVLRPTRPAAEVLDDIKCHVERFSPGLLADFEKVKGQEHHSLRVGDEFHIRILGPWNGTVRVTKVGKTFFELITLENHPEAGRIRFSLKALPGVRGGLRFEIHSWARSRDGLVAFAYDTLGVGRRVQQQTWCTFCERVAEASGGTVRSKVEVETITREDGQIIKVEKDA